MAERSDDDGRSSFEARGIRRSRLGMTDEEHASTKAPSP